MVPNPRRMTVIPSLYDSNTENFLPGNTVCRKCILVIQDSYDSITTWVPLPLRFVC